MLGRWLLTVFGEAAPAASGVDHDPLEGAGVGAGLLFFALAPLVANAVGALPLLRLRPRGVRWALQPADWVGSKRRLLGVVASLESLAAVAGFAWVLNSTGQLKPSSLLPMGAFALIYLVGALFAAAGLYRHWVDNQ